jgi:hypothetical protein
MMIKIAKQLRQHFLQLSYCHLHFKTELNDNTFFYQCGTEDPTLCQQTRQLKVGPPFATARTPVVHMCKSEIIYICINGVHTSTN